MLSALTAGKVSTASEEKLGVGLARLHRKSSKRFGFESDNFIGSLPQPNGWLDNWGEFFIERRLRFQIELGQAKGWATKDTVRLLSRRETKIFDLLNSEPEPPSLLHGDLWSGNVFWSNEGPALIDPAVYYGCREADVAFTKLFGGFGQVFYDAYHTEFPLLDGFSERARVHNLYHLLTHSNLFGGEYISSAVSTLKGL